MCTNTTPAIDLSPSVVLHRVLRQERLWPPLHARLKRWPDQVVEQERAVYQQCETEHLEPLERLPSQTERHDPDEECTAGIDRRARCSRDSARDGQTKEVEATAAC